MKREDALIIVDHFGAEVNRPGTTTSYYHGYNSWTTYLVRDSSYSYDSVFEWEVPGLFISNNEVRYANKPYLTTFYKMSCGTLLVLVLPVIVNEGSVKVPNNFTVLRRNGILHSDIGFWIAIDHWHKVADLNEYLTKRGATKRPHLAKKVHKG